MKRILSLWLLFSAAGWASAGGPRTLAQRAALSHRVALVQVLAQRVERGPDGRPAKTLTQVVVGEEFKGRGPAELTIVQLGGRSGGWEARVAGDAAFQLGETAVVFLACRAPDRCALVGLADGKLDVDRWGAVRHREGPLGEWRVRPLGELRAEVARATSAGSVEQRLAR